MAIQVTDPILLGLYHAKLKADPKLVSLHALMLKIFGGMNWCIAGGAIRDTLIGVEPKDYDVFVSWSRLGIYKALEDSKVPYVSGAAGKGPFAELQHEGKTVQIMARKGGSPENAIKEFDFNICMFGWTWADTILAYSPLPAPGVELVANNIVFPALALRRAAKFVGKYRLTISNDTLFDLFNRATVAYQQGEEDDWYGLDAENTFQPLPDLIPY